MERAGPDPEGAGVRPHEPGNHGEDVKEYWWYLDAVPSHAWNRWRYHYPQAAFPYQDLIDVNAARDRYQFEYELLDTGVFDGEWNEADGLFYDRLLTPSGNAIPVKVRSMVGIILALAAAVIDGDILRRVMTRNKGFMGFMEHEGFGI